MSSLRTAPAFDLITGVFPLGAPSTPQLRALCGDAEQAGLGGIWVRDHLVFHHPVYDPVVLLGAIAGWTASVELGTAVYLPALRNPVAVAKAFASLVLLSGRRVNLGVGVGGEYEREWRVAGAPVASRGRRLDESLRIAGELWSGATASHDGSLFGPFEDLTLDLGPVPRSELRVWVGGKSDAALRRVARAGDGWLPYFRSGDALATQLARLDELLEEAGREPREVQRALILYVVLDEDAGAGLETARAFCERDFDKPLGDLADRYALVGSPARVSEEIARFRELGIERFLVLFATGPEEQRRQLERFATEVASRPEVAAR